MSTPSDHARRAAAVVLEATNAGLIARGDIYRQQMEARVEKALRDTQAECHILGQRAISAACAERDAEYRILLESAKLHDTRLLALEEALAFAACTIKSGEPWTETCENVIGALLCGEGEGERGS